MEEHDVTLAELEALTLGGDKAEFINHLVSMLGQNSQATVAYQTTSRN